MMNLLKLFLLCVTVFVAACQQTRSAKEKEIVEAPAQLNERVPPNIQAVLLYADEHGGEIDDHLKLKRSSILRAFFEQRDFANFWSDNGQQLPYAVAFLDFLKNCEYHALYPAQYHYPVLDTLATRLRTDSVYALDAMAWTRFELLLSDAFISTVKDLKEGRLVADSVSILNDAGYFIKQFKLMEGGEDVKTLLTGLEPTESRYVKLQQVARGFVENMDRKQYLRLTYPYKDSLEFVRNVYKRLVQSGYGNARIDVPDSLEYTGTVKKYQADHVLTVDGIAGGAVVRSLNFTDAQKFLQFAIACDKYKLLGNYPPEYILVNIPSFHLQVFDNESVVLDSRVIVGKVATATPEIISEVSNMITYPQWVVPPSIIRKEILPQLKMDPGYLYRKGFNIVDAQGVVVDPYSVDWSKYNKWIPWRVIQGSGDDNALGVFKFNFRNDHSVYLHDTNQPYLFQNTNRALSHGCVRVQKWKELAEYIAERDGFMLASGQTPGYNADSIRIWIANQSRKTILVKNKLPLYIQYFTCEEKNGNIEFYMDIYGKDKKLAKRYF